jgi:tetratricopeptide (TPR) repeat protein
VSTAPAAAGAPVAAGAAALTPDSALGELRQANRPTDARLKEIEAVIATAGAGEPREAKWVLAKALLARLRGDRTAAKTLATQAAELSPRDAEMQYWKGATIFEGIQDVGMFGKMSAADDGKAAFDEAVRLDSTHVKARLGLIQFYVNAPGIAGGSYAKAKEQARAIADLPGFKIRGLLSLAGVHVAEEEWADAERVYVDAAAAASNDAERAEAGATHVYALLTKKKDATAAVARLESSKLLPSEDDRLNFVAGEVYSAKARWPEAIASYQKVLARNPDSGNCMIGLGKALVASGDAAGGVAQFERFLAVLPNDGRVDTVRDLLKDAKKKAAAKR